MNGERVRSAITAGHAHKRRYDAYVHDRAAAAEDALVRGLDLALRALLAAEGGQLPEEVGLGVVELGRGLDDHLDDQVAAPRVPQPRDTSGC